LFTPQDDCDLQAEPSADACGVPKLCSGNYTINLHVAEELLGDRPFRVIKLY
jgi:hypothetical protein